MPTCSIRQCGSRKNKMWPELTLHRFPTNEKLKKKWMEAIGVENINSHHKVLWICSKHFEEKNFNRTLDVVRLRDNSVPSLFTVDNLSTIKRYPIRSRGSIADPPQSIEQSDKMEDDIASSPEPQSSEVQFCMVCLNTSEYCQLYSASTYNLDMEFEHLTGISLQGMTFFEPQFCSECAQRLSNCSKFRDRSLRAYRLLMESVEEHKMFTTQYITSLRRSNNLGSSISKKTYEPDHCDLHLKHIENREKNEEMGRANEKTRKVNETRINENYFSRSSRIKTGKFNEKTTNEETVDNKTVSIKIECVNGNLILNPVKENEMESGDNNQTDYESDGNSNDDDNFDGDDATDSNTESDLESTATNKETRSNNVGEYRAVLTKSKAGKPKQPIKVKALLKQYNITELTHEEQLKDLENRKTKSSYIVGYHKCLKCFKGFLNVKNYKIHMEKHTDKYGKCECPVCGLRYRSERHVGRHVANVHRRRFSCYSCPFVTNEKSAAVQHLKCHQKDYFTCPHCLEELRSKSYYLAHLRTVHCTELSCVLCDRAFKNERGLHSHINLVHFRQDPGTPVYVCEECHMRFSCEAEYRQHLESHKSGTDGNAKRKAQEILSSPEDHANNINAGENLTENFLVPENETKIEEEDYIPTEYLEDFDDYNDIDLELGVINDADNNVEFTPADTKEYRTIAIDDTINEVDASVEFTPADTKEYRSITIDDTTLDPKVVAKEPKKEVDFEYLKQYTITQLSHEQQCEEINKRKESSNFLNSEFKCVICFKGFNYIDTFNIHMEKHTDKYGEFECPVCSLHFAKRMRLLSHVACAHSRRYACIGCPLVTTLRTTAINHARWHKGIVYQCKHCPEEFFSKSACLSHIRIFHPTDVVCPLCGFSFVNERGLQMHLHLKHRSENVRNLNGPLCEQCDIRFASHEAYQQHLEVSPKHADDSVPKRNTPRKPWFKNRIKNSNGPMKCEQCGLQLSSYVSYFHHFRLHHPDKARTQLRRTALLCEQCGSAFMNPAHLQRHMLTHTGARPYLCDACGRAFRTKAHVAQHMATHGHGGAAHACPVCGKEFSLEKNRDRHLWTHEAQRPFKCSECDRTFADPSTRRTHAAHAHRGLPYPRRRRGPPLRASRPLAQLRAVCGVRGLADPLT